MALAHEIAVDKDFQLTKLEPNSQVKGQRYLVDRCGISIADRLPHSVRVLTPAATECLYNNDLLPYFRFE